MQLLQSKWAWIVLGAVVLLGGQHGLPWIANKVTTPPVESVITGPQRVEPATVVKLFGDQSKGNPTLFRWRSDGAKFELVDGGRNILTSIDHKVCAKFELMVTDGKTDSVAEWQVSANDAQPDQPQPIPVKPNPEPAKPNQPDPAKPDEPKPQPKPVTPDPPTPGPLDKVVLGVPVAREVYTAILSVKSDSRQAECQQLADSLQSVIDRIGQELDKPAKIVPAIVEELKRLPPSWRLAIGRLVTILEPLSKSGKLDDIAAWRLVLGEVKVGATEAKRVQ